MKKITQVEAKRIMDGGSDIYILDVREPDELYEGYIDESILIPLDDLNEKTAAEKLPDKNKAVLVYCRSGKRSMAAAERLDEMGYTNVCDFGGILDWPFDLII